MRLACCIFLFLVGCASTPQAETGKEFQATSDGQIRSGDHLIVEFKNRAVQKITRVVDAKGYISLPLGEELRVSGMNLKSAERAIESLYVPVCFSGPLSLKFPRVQPVTR